MEMKAEILQPLHNGFKVGGHRGRIGMKEGSAEDLLELFPEDIKGLHPLNNFTAKYHSLPADIPLPCALMTLSSARSLR